MTLLRRTLLAAVIAGGMVAAAAAPVGAGILTLTVTGVATCDPATTTTTINWNLQSNQSGFTVIATQNPSGEVLAVTPSPLQNGSNTATGTVPGTTVGAVTLSVAVTGGPTILGTVNVGACPTPVAAALPAGPDFTG